MANENAAALLSVAEMYRADTAAVAAGVASIDLMEAAGRAVADQIRARWAPRPVAVLCGPGNNGGDGFVVARLLAADGWPVTIALLGDREALKGDAAANARRWIGSVPPLGPDAIAGAGLIVDAIFGAGLARAVDGAAGATIAAINASGIPCVSVDVPSGVHGDNGAVMGAAPRAVLTVTFFRMKPGHLLLPGRAHAGEVVVADIGIPDTVLADIHPRSFVNEPALWLAHYPWPMIAGHKYDRGHAVVFGGAEMTGAGRLAARAALRIGAGLVTVAAAPGARAIYQSDQTAALLTSAVDGLDAIAKLLDDKRKTAALIGPGYGVGGATREAVRRIVAATPAVLDADALTSFADEPGALFAAIKGKRCVLTPHEGEFARIFSIAGDKLTRARTAAARCGAVVVLKGPDTVIAHPDGRAAINANAPPELATGGTGDVLAGMILGLLAQNVDPFIAACAAVWLHGAAATAVGPGLIADDLPRALPAVLRELKERAATA
ncbi:MAG TPA: NAD(P)H-hydrate dehydratase [Alphaproteobacteria bacterium]